MPIRRVRGRSFQAAETGFVSRDGVRRWIDQPLMNTGGFIGFDNDYPALNQIFEFCNYQFRLLSLAPRLLDVTDAVVILNSLDYYLDFMMINSIGSHDKDKQAHQTSFDRLNVAIDYMDSIQKQVHKARSMLSSKSGAVMERGNSEEISYVAEKYRVFYIKSTLLIEKEDEILRDYPKKTSHEQTKALVGLSKNLSEWRRICDEQNVIFQQAYSRVSEIIGRSSPVTTEAVLKEIKNLNIQGLTLEVYRNHLSNIDKIVRKLKIFDIDRQIRINPEKYGISVAKSMLESRSQMKPGEFDKEVTFALKLISSKNYLLALNIFLELAYKDGYQPAHDHGRVVFKEFCKNFYNFSRNFDDPIAFYKVCRNLVKWDHYVGSAAALDKVRSSDLLLADLFDKLGFNALIKIIKYFHEGDIESVVKMLGSLKNSELTHPIILNTAKLMSPTIQILQLFYKGKYSKALELYSVDKLAIKNAIVAISSFEDNLLSPKLESAFEILDALGSVSSDFREIDKIVATQGKSKISTSPESIRRILKRINNKMKVVFSEQALVDSTIRKYLLSMPKDPSSFISKLAFADGFSVAMIQHAVMIAAQFKVLTPSQLFKSLLFGGGPEVDISLNLFLMKMLTHESLSLEPFLKYYYMTHIMELIAEGDVSALYNQIKFIRTDKDTPAEYLEMLGTSEAALATLNLISKSYYYNASSPFDIIAFFDKNVEDLISEISEIDLSRVDSPQLKGFLKLTSHFGGVLLDFKNALIECSIELARVGSARQDKILTLLLPFGIEMLDIIESDVSDLLLDKVPQLKDLRRYLKKDNTSLRIREGIESSLKINSRATQREGSLLSKKDRRKYKKKISLMAKDITPSSLGLGLRRVKPLKLPSKLPRVKNLFKSKSATTTTTGLNRSESLEIDSKHTRYQGGVSHHETIESDRKYAHNQVITEFSHRQSPLTLEDFRKTPSLEQIHLQKKNQESLFVYPLPFVVRVPFKFDTVQPYFDKCVIGELLENGNLSASIKALLALVPDLGLDPVQYLYKVANQFKTKFEILQRGPVTLEKVRNVLEALYSFDWFEDNPSNVNLMMLDYLSRHGYLAAIDLIDALHADRLDLAIQIFDTHSEQFSSIPFLRKILPAISPLFKVKLMVDKGELLQAFEIYTKNKDSIHSVFDGISSSIPNNIHAIANTVLKMHKAYIQFQEALSKENYHNAKQINMQLYEHFNDLLNTHPELCDHYVDFLRYFEKAENLNRSEVSHLVLFVASDSELVFDSVNKIVDLIEKSHKKKPAKLLVECCVNPDLIPLLEFVGRFPGLFKVGSRNVAVLKGFASLYANLESLQFDKAIDSLLFIEKLYNPTATKLLSPNLVRFSEQILSCKELTAKSKLPSKLLLSVKAFVPFVEWLQGRDISNDNTNQAMIQQWLKESSQKILQFNYVLHECVDIITSPPKDVDVDLVVMSKLMLYGKDVVELFLSMKKQDVESLGSSYLQTIWKEVHKHKNTDKLVLALENLALLVHAKATANAFDISKICEILRIHCDINLITKIQATLKALKLEPETLMDRGGLAIGGSLTWMAAKISDIEEPKVVSTNSTKVSNALYLDVAAMVSSLWSDKSKRAAPLTPDSPMTDQSLSSASTISDKDALDISEELGDSDSDIDPRLTTSNLRKK